MMHNIIISLIYLFTSCLMLVFGKKLYMKFLKYDMYQEIKNENYTGIIPYCGFMLGNTAILAGAFIGPDSQVLFWKEYLYYITYAILGMSLIILSGYIAEKAILYKFNNTDEIVRDKNIGTAAVQFGIYFASGLIISACVAGDTLLAHGKWYGLFSTLVYYILGMIFLVTFAKIHDILTPYSLQEEIENDNASVGISFGGHIVAISIILMKATIGDFETWEQGLITYFIDLTVIILLLPSIRFILDKVIVKDFNIAREIRNNNIAAGLGEACVIISFALLIFFMVDFNGIV